MLIVYFAESAILLLCPENDTERDLAFIDRYWKVCAVEQRTRRFVQPESCSQDQKQCRKKTNRAIDLGRRREVDGSGV
jgi:hypothetical protein